MLSRAGFFLVEDNNKNWFEYKILEFIDFPALLVNEQTQNLVCYFLFNAKR
jgi:hypothetical protein